MIKELLNVEMVKRLAEYNRKKREDLAKAQKVESKPKLTSSQYYRVSVFMAIGVLGILGYYIYQSKKGDATYLVQ